MKTRFNVVQGKISTASGEAINRWFILDEGIPLFIANEWIEFKTIVNEKTGKKYVGNLCRYLNFLNVIGKEYYTATKKDVLSFINHLIFTTINDHNIKSTIPNITYSTLRGYVVTIKGFYQYLLENSEQPIIKKRAPYFSMKESYYSGIMDVNYSEFIDSKLRILKSSKEYKKWYTPKEVQVLLSNFLTLRDKAIFLITLDGGMRIDEALSIHLSDYNRPECIVKPTRSKGKINGEGRPVVLKESTCEIIDRYIWNERNVAESLSENYTDSLFINLRKGKYQGMEVKPGAWLTVLKNTAKRAGLNPDEIRTHSGRSSKAMELLIFQAENPQQHLTDEMIRQWMGWKSSKSIDPYRNINDIRLAISRAVKINTNLKNTMRYGE